MTWRLWSTYGFVSLEHYDVLHKRMTVLRFRDALREREAQNVYQQVAQGRLAQGGAQWIYQRPRQRRWVG